VLEEFCNVDVNRCSKNIEQIYELHIIDITKVSSLIQKEL